MTNSHSMSLQSFAVDGKVYGTIMKFVCNGPIPKSWCQPFVFKSGSVCLLQYAGGPCGLLAAVQAHINLILRSKSGLSNKELLCEAVLNIMELIRPCFVFCSDFDPAAKRIEWTATQNRDDALQYLKTSGMLSKDNAAILLTISLTILVGPIWLKSYGICDSFITEDGQTNMTLVLLMITGDVLDSYHDGNTVMGGIVFKGALTPRQIGILSVDNFQGCQKSGMLFKKPTARIWVAYYGGHFNTIVATDQAIYEFDALAHQTLFTVVTEKHIFWNDLQIGMQPL